MDNFQIETAQNVSIYQNVATIGDRILAYLIDGIILFAYWILSLVLLASFGLESNDTSDLWTFFLILGLPTFLYHLLMETFWDGRSLGKAAMNIRVVKLDGSKPGFGSFLVRWIMRIIDVSLSSGGVAIVSILINDKGQRLGDMAAGTSVISEKRSAFLSQTIIEDLPENYTPRYPQVTVFTDKDMQKIKSVYQNARKKGNHRVLIQLSDQIKKVAKIEPQESPMTFIRTVISDYNYYTQK